MGCAHAVRAALLSSLILPLGLLSPGLLACEAGPAAVAHDAASPTDSVHPGDVHADGPQDAAAPETCEPGDQWCEGDTAWGCEGGEATSSPCGEGAFCNAGQCLPSAISLPTDASPHGQTIEWWYYTGHLRVDTDAAAAASPTATQPTGSWGFELALFQQDMSFFGTGMDGLGFMCHVAVTDKIAKNHVHADSITLDTEQWPPQSVPWPVSPPTTLEVQPCLVELGGDGHDHIRATVADPAGEQGPAGEWVFDLDVTPTKHVTYHGGDGVISMTAAAGDSYYYSYTRMEARGTLSVPGAVSDGAGGPVAVRGQAWMDHQWGDFDANAFKGWDWWSVQLDSGYELMLFQFRDWDDVLVMQRATVTDPDGGQTDLPGLDAVTVTSLRQWASPHTDGVYPLDWNLDIPSLGWHLEIRTPVDDQEMPNLAQNYWEGCVDVTGTRGGVQDTGVGYVELTGYATDPLDPK